VAPEVTLLARRLTSARGRFNHVGRVHICRLPADDRRAKKNEEMIMKTVIATALVALGLLTTAISAQAATDYPDWAQTAFEQGRNGGY
jgi:hypothetical protein